MLTSRGKGVAVVQSLEEYEKVIDQCDFMRGVVQGSSEIDAGKGIDMDEVKNKLGL